MLILESNLKKAAHPFSRGVVGQVGAGGQNLFSGEHRAQRG